MAVIQRVQRPRPLEERSDAVGVEVVECDCYDSGCGSERVRVHGLGLSGEVAFVVDTVTPLVKNSVQARDTHHRHRNTLVVIEEGHDFYASVSVDLCGARRASLGPFHSNRLPPHGHCPVLVTCDYC